MGSWGKPEGCEGTELTQEGWWQMGHCPLGHSMWMWRSLTHRNSGTINTNFRGKGTVVWMLQLAVGLRTLLGTRHLQAHFVLTIEKEGNQWPCLLGLSPRSERQDDMVDECRLPVFRISCSPAVCLWVSYASSLNFNSLICNMGAVM